MIAGLIAAASLVALVPLYMSYCRALLVSARKVELSDRVSVLADVGGGVSGDDFDRIVQLVRLCPVYDDDHSSVRAVTLYYRLVQALGRIATGVSPAVVLWTDRECGHCSHFAAVVLDRCISSSRSLFTEQASDRL